MLCPGDPVYGYLRVSGDEQADRGLPVAGQREAIERYCAAHQLLLARVFVDEAISGGTDHRPAFRELLRLAGQTPAPVRGVLIWNWSRFARQQDDAHYWKASLRRHGVEIVPIDDSVPSVPGFEYVLESFIHWKDEQRRLEISEDARRGQQTLARMGFVPSGARPPFGFRVAFSEQAIEGRVRQLRRWVPDPAAWPVARRAWELRLQGATYREIGVALGLRRGIKFWMGFFGNPIYRGVLIFGGSEIPVEPLVTVEEWQLVNARRRSAEVTGSQGGRRKATRPYLLSGLLRCARCDSLLYGVRRVRQRAAGAVHTHYYYLCARRANHRACDLPAIPADAIEQAVIAALFAQVLTPENLAAQLQEYAAAQASAREPLAAQLAAARAQVSSFESAVAALLDAIESGGRGVASLAARLVEREKALSLARSNLAALEARRSAPPATPDPARFRAALEAALGAGDRAALRDALATVIVAVYVDTDCFRLVYRPPLASPTEPGAVPIGGASPSGERLPIGALALSYGPLPFRCK